MRWVPPRAGDPGLDDRAAGTHKIAGTTVEAVVGGYYINLSAEVILHMLPSLMPALTHTQGGRFAHRLFHTCVLPHLLLPGSPFGLPDVLHADALRAVSLMST